MVNNGCFLKIICGLPNVFESNGSDSANRSHDMLFISDVKNNIPRRVTSLKMVFRESIYIVKN